MSTPQTPLAAGLVQLLAAAVAVALGFLLPQAHIGYNIPVSEAVPMLVGVGAATVTFIGVGADGVFRGRCWP